MSEAEYLNSGSRWHRWEPHIHAPGTILNDQFKGADAWDRYLVQLEAVSPSIRAIGITDYYSLDSYERVRQSKSDGRLVDCALVFPNVEMRLKLGTVKGAWVNVHLLVSPEEPDHVDEVKRFLSRLTFEAFEDTFCCSPDDLVRLGQRADPTNQTQGAALKHGSEQFKVSFDQLRELYRASAWAKDNILIAVAGGTSDGTSGVREAADTTIRQEVERFAHVIFASSSNQRDFWLGRKSLDVEEIRRRYGGLKPCLHGSDAHEHRTIGVPDGSRFSWVKGALAFDTLRQACIDPAGRAYVGDSPPIAAAPSQVISKVTISGAPWITTPNLELNPGLVAVIGARGSGKTALADIIAAGCDAIADWPNAQSFLSRAEEYLGNASVQLCWETGGTETRVLNDANKTDAEHYPRARYLSQQFVEELCASDGMTDALLREIERVVFEAHDTTEREGTVDFEELLALRAARHRQARSREEEALANISDRIGSELLKDRLVLTLRGQVTEKSQLIARYEGDRKKLVATGSEERLSRLGALTKAADKVRTYVRFYSAQHRTLLALRDDVRDVRDNQTPEMLRAMQSRHTSSGLKSDEWLSFLLDFKGDVDTLLTERLTSAQTNAKIWTGVQRDLTVTPISSQIAPDADLDRQPLALLEAEIMRLEKLISVDRDTASKFSAFSKRIGEEAAAHERLKEKLEDCEQAKGRIAELVPERETTYVRVFEAILAEQAVLSDLYAPLMARLAASGHTLRKLSFSVERIADVHRWANEGEDLLDLRRLGPFRGRGALEQHAEHVLKRAWECGSAEEIGTAMALFRSEHQSDLLQHSPVPRSDPEAYRAWTKRFAQWLYSTHHISVRYSVQYDGVDIRKLSPGTRGIVLLLLYLALDDADDRPLIIDQPEENLDPKSIFEELVDLFCAAKSKRQIIIVTHNANLVINTDADQIIVANAGPQPAGDLPPISYESGGLESSHIRKAVCEILEGGEEAFRERARRLRVRLQR
jgi:energy-coupling factor transporter ATP-binding protein EcfA2